MPTIRGIRPAPTLEKRKLDKERGAQHRLIQKGTWQEPAQCLTEKKDKSTGSNRGGAKFHARGKQPEATAMDPESMPEESMVKHRAQIPKIKLSFGRKNNARTNLIRYDQANRNRHKQTNTQMRPRTCSCTRTRTRTCTSTHHTRTNTHTHIHAHTHAHTHACIHALWYVDSCRFASTAIRMHTFSNVGCTNRQTCDGAALARDHQKLNVREPPAWKHVTLRNTSPHKESWSNVEKWLVHIYWKMKHSNILKMKVSKYIEKMQCQISWTKTLINWPLAWNVI